MDYIKRYIFFDKGPFLWRKILVNAGKEKKMIGIIFLQKKYVNINFIIGEIIYSRNKSLMIMNLSARNEVISMQVRSMRLTIQVLGGIRMCIYADQHNEKWIIISPRGGTKII